MTFIANAIIESMFGYQNYNNIYFVTTFESPIHLKVEKNLTTTLVKKVYEKIVRGRTWQKITDKIAAQTIVQRRLAKHPWFLGKVTIARIDTRWPILFLARNCTHGDKNRTKSLIGNALRKLDWREWVVYVHFTRPWRPSKYFQSPSFSRSELWIASYLKICWPLENKGCHYTEKKRQFVNIWPCLIH